MRLLTVLFFIFSMLKADDFIAKRDYAKLLYSNPRGIGCNKCHGEDGKGLVIAHIKKKGEVKEFSAPRIDNVSKQAFFKALNSSKSVMPKYSLTNEEMGILFEY
ncbi:MAG: cytochrome c, partial [Campylobacteraceae bacterium]|nr:cytochrome c [Campylobacteraceae bacterium]